MAKFVCVLYDDPVDGYPKSYPRDDLPKIDRYPDGQSLPTPKAIDFKPGTAWKRFRRAGAAKISRGQWPQAHRDLRQGWGKLGP